MLSDYLSYVELIKKSGYKIVFENTLQNNYFNYLVNSENVIYTYFLSNSKELRIIAEKNKEHTFTSEGKCITEAAVFASAISDRSFYIRLPDNTVVIIDGGWRGEDLRNLDNTSLYLGFVNELKKITGSEIITVRAWFITHPHDDHTTFLERAHEFGVEKYFNVHIIIRNTPSDNDFPFCDRWCNDFTYHEKLEDIYKKWCGNNVINARTGMHFSLSGVDFDIYMTPDDLIADRINALSIVIMQSYNGRRVLWTGDMSDSCGNLVLKLYGDSIKCDAVQISHHGWGGAGSVDFYRTCQAPVQIWNNTEFGFKYHDPRQGYGKSPISTEVYDLPEVKRHIFCGGIRMEKLSLVKEMYTDFENEFKIK